MKDCRVKETPEEPECEHVWRYNERTLGWCGYDVNLQFNDNGQVHTATIDTNSVVGETYEWIFDDICCDLCSIVLDVDIATVTVNWN
jgi:hypothetical protein